jgi:hypothetical protein
VAPRPYIQALCTPLKGNEFPHSSPEAPSHQAARKPSVSEGGNYMNFALSVRNFAATESVFYMPQSWDMGQIL